MLKEIVSIDPGLEKAAYARWNPEDGSLLDAGLVVKKHEPGMARVQKWKEIAWRVREMASLCSGKEISLVVEIPQIYSGPREEDPNDLIDLAGVVGAIAAIICIGSVVWSPVPREWKGQAPKSVTKQRVDKRLTSAEKALIKWPVERLKHNVYDAIHLGIVYLEKKGLRDAPLPDRYPNQA